MDLCYLLLTKSPLSAVHLRGDGSSTLGRWASHPCLLQAQAQVEGLPLSGQSSWGSCLACSGDCTGTGPGPCRESPLGHQASFSGSALCGW